MIEKGKILQKRYRVEKQIGQGGMGAVYVAVDERFGSTVAIKQTLCMDDNYRRAIEREARLLNSLKHPALPRVSDHFVEDDGQFIVMEFIPGEDLCCILEDQGKPFPAEQVITWAGQLLDALEFLHNQESPVIHRDIKPQNLKVTPKGQIILLDFGLAKGNPSEMGGKSTTKSIFGYSRNYASLEQIQGTGTDPRSDLYSLAATLYHLLTGAPPEDALTRAMSVLSERPDPLEPASQLNPKVPRGLSAVLTMAMDLNADLRPQSARQMREMLVSYENYAELDVVKTATAGGRSNAVHAERTRLLPENTANVAAGTEAVTALMPADASQVTRLRPIPETIGSDSSKPSGKRRFAYAAGGLGMLLIAGIIVAGVVSYSDLGASDVQVAEPVQTAIPAANIANIANANPVEANSWQANLTNNGAEVASQPERTQKTPQPERKTPTTDGKVTVSSPEGLENERIVIEGDKIYIGNRVLDANSFEFRRMNPNDPRFGPRRPPIPPQVPNANFRPLTPEEIRKIREARRIAANANLQRQP
ncbi:MAG: serine/threonine protein kinase [Acidobacteria bacterium]|nr:serine/threonine protein kinase [Acidobacteriota bacterium]